MDKEKKARERGDLEYARYRWSKFYETNGFLISSIKFIIPAIFAIYFGYENNWDKVGMAATFAIVLLITFLASKISLKTHIIAIVVAGAVGFLSEILSQWQ